MMSPHLVAISLLMSPVWASAPGNTPLLPQETSPQEQGSRPAGTQEEAPEGDDPTAPPLELLDLGFADCISRAERLEKMVVVFWTGYSEPRNRNMRESILEDPEVRRWLAKHAIITEINTEKNKADARQNRIGPLQIPSIDIYSVKRSLRLERLTYGTESIDFLAAVLGQTDGEVVVRPEGDAINEPFRWLAWANIRYQEGDVRAAEDALFAYQWCMQTADALRPGFRARFLEYILRRISGLKGRSAAAGRFLEQERTRLKKRMFDGRASRRDVYEYTRFFDWLDVDEDIVTLFSELDSSKEIDRQYQIWLLPTAAPILGRHESFEKILSAVGADSKEIFLARSRGIAAEIARVNAMPQLEGSSPSEGNPDADKDAAKDETPTAEVKVVPAPKGRFDEEALPHTIGDNRADLLDDASWVFEALLSAQRDEEAMTLQRALAKIYPEAPRTYALFVDRALRQERWAIAAEIADVGMANVDERGQKRLGRLQAKIAKLAGK